MPELIPLKSYYYREGKDDPDKLKELTSPPYDVIDLKYEVIELKKDPNNICHIILPENYNAAGKKLDEMIANETLVCEEDRCIYIYGIDYKRPDNGEPISRYGFVGLLRLVEVFPAFDGVIPHEATFKKSTEDRFQLIKRTDSNFSPIFTIYNGNGSAESVFKKYITKKPFLQTSDRDDFTHKIWQIKDENDIKAIQKIVRTHPIIIADGHHRYITCLRHSRRGGCKYIMALFIDFNDPGLIIYTSHRQIHKMPVKTIAELQENVKEYFEIVELQNFDKLQHLMKESTESHIFGCYFQKKYLCFKLKDTVHPANLISGRHTVEWKCLNLPILHQILLNRCLKVEENNITYIKDVNKGLEKVENGLIDALFIVNPTTLGEIHKIVHLGEIMPQKSTYFYPKPLSGLVIHKHSGFGE